MHLKELTNQEFQSFIASYPLKSLYQTPEYGFVMNAQDYDTLFLGLIDEQSHIVAASLILIEKLKGFKYAYAPRGFLIDYENKALLKTFTLEIKKFLGKKDVIAIKISPLVVRKVHDTNHNVVEKNSHVTPIFENLKELGFYHLGYNSYFEAMKPRFEAILDLDLPYYMLFQNFKKGFRTKIRSAVTNGIQVFKGTKENLEYLYLHTKKKYPRDLKYYQDCYEFFSKLGKIDFFYAKLNTEIYLKHAQKIYAEKEQEANLMNDLIMGNAGRNTTKIIGRKIKVDNEYDNAKKNLILATKLLRDYPEGLILASSLVVKSQDEAYLMMDGFDATYKTFNAKHLLIWKMIEKYSKQNYKKFNFGGVTNPLVEDNKYQGLNDFRTSFNAKVVEYIGDFELITNSALYFVYRNVPIKGIFKR